MKAPQGEPGAAALSHGGIHLLGVCNQGGFSEVVASQPRPGGKRGLDGEWNEPCEKGHPPGRRGLLHGSISACALAASDSSSFE